jgi:Fe2+ or Zn2+ uptake regulation protein
MTQAIKTRFSRGTVREGFAEAVLKESGLTYTAFRSRVLRALEPNATALELTALDICTQIEAARTAKEKSIKTKIRKIHAAKQQEG